jgi:hypothetical protein
MEKQNKALSNERRQVAELVSKCLTICGVPANLKKLVDHFNVKAVKIVMPDGVSGLVLPDPYQDRFVLAVNGAMPYYHRRFTVAHELYHIIRRTKHMMFRQSMNTHKGEERLANIFAAELLMPAIEIERLHAEGCRSVEAYCKHFKVSKAAMKIRLFKELRLPEFS